MFALRGLAISLSVFVTIYCGLSLIVCITWRRLQLLAKGVTIERLAGALFFLRMFPLAAALSVTGVLAVPSFLLLEPHAIVEPIGGPSLFLALCGVAVVVLGVGNVLIGIGRTSRTISGWLIGAQALQSSPFPVLRTPHGTPPMTVVGIVHPRILISSVAESMLDAAELRSALNHEMAHVRRRDNLKKLLLRFVVFPGMCELESAWLEAAEMAADDTAVSNPAEALDLAAALIKMCRLGCLEPSAELSMALLHSPAAVMNGRVERLIHWSDQPHAEAEHLRPFVLGAGVTLLVALGLSYSHLLTGIHVITEWLVR